jgi:REP element-mobilizing transposase RayT
MARPLRLEFPGAVYHITARGDRREAIFLDDEDRLRFIDLLAKETKQQGWLLYAFCLMDNHYHLLLETPQPNLVRGMRRLNGVYTQAFNRAHGLVGHVLQGRYKSILVDKDAHLRELCRYVVLNPMRVRKPTIKSLSRYPWSSYLATAGRMPSPQWLSTGLVQTLFGSRKGAAIKAYERFVADGLNAPSPWLQLSAQVYLGPKPFLERMQRKAAKRSAENVPRAQRQPARPSAHAVLGATAKDYGMTPKEVLGRSHPQAFKMAVYRLRREANLPLRTVAEMAGVSPGRVSQIQAEVESMPSSGL